MGCSKQPPAPVHISDIIGTWETHPVYIEELGVLKHQVIFSPGGLVEWRVISGNGEVRMTSSGNYIIQKDNVIQKDKLLFSGDIADVLTTQLYFVSMLTPDTLLLINDGITEFSRIKNSESVRPESQ
jgi:hypothetical protein